MTMANSGDYYVLELVVDSLKDNPKEIGEFIRRVSLGGGKSMRSF